jgi:hypothetical protein
MDEGASLKNDALSDQKLETHIQGVCTGDGEKLLPIQLEDPSSPNAPGM